ncbi:hypothetical protein OUZ56_019472 [Daphnia magna]|uniref:Uncharacterized protein n=1 Tax=Daphnia magna TaxID=35525 RepID=A0ABQ9ZCF6_9CRUS|nr:hypothetical protein OUZ56_019472 [Daphnia magna]
MSLFAIWKRSISLPRNLLLFIIAVFIIAAYVQISLKMNDDEVKQEICCSSSYWDELLDSESLTGEQLMEYFTWTNRSSCQLAHDIGGKMLRNPSGIDGQKSGQPH